MGVAQLHQDEIITLGMVFDCRSVELVKSHAVGRHVPAVREVVDDLLSVGEVPGLPTQLPRDVPGSEQLVRLMKAHIGIRVSPHATGPVAAVDQRHTLRRIQIVRRDRECVQPRDARAHDTEVDP